MFNHTVYKGSICIWILIKKVIVLYCICTAGQSEYLDYKKNKILTIHSPLDVGLISRGVVVIANIRSRTRTGLIEWHWDWETRIVVVWEQIYEMAEKTENDGWMWDKEVIVFLDNEAR